MKHLIRKFILINSIILCICLIVLGAVTVRQKSDYNMYRKDYTVAFLAESEGKVVLNVNGEKRAAVDLSFLSEWENKRKYLKYTPFGSAYYFAETLQALF